MFLIGYGIEIGNDRYKAAAIGATAVFIYILNIFIVSRFEFEPEGRHLLEQKTSLHMATIAEFEEIRRESQLRLVKALQAQNEAAKKRNKEFLEEVLVDKDNFKPQVTLHCKLH